MIAARAGSAAWLLQHELRLFWRGRGPKRFSMVFLGIVLVLLHLIGAALAFATTSTQPAPPVVRLLIFTVGMAFLLVTMLSRCLFLVVEALYTRRDMELLLTSPLAPSAFVGARTVGIAATVTLEFALLIFPFANAFVLFGQFEWAKAYLLVPACAMLAACLALLIGLAMFRLFGPRRTKVFAQILSALIGMGFVLLGQLPNLMQQQDKPGLAPFGKEAVRQGMAWVGQLAALVLDGVLPTLIFTGLAIAALTTAALSLGKPFVAASLASSAPQARKRGAGKATAAAFRASPHRILVAKELRLIARDPALMAQILQQIVFAAPLGFMLWKANAQGTPWVWLTLILVVGSCASALGWIVFTAEDAPDLLAASPMPRRTLLRAKLEAALTPVAPIAALPLIVLPPTHPVFAVTLALCASGAAFSCILLHVRRGGNRKRAEFNARDHGSSGSGIVELLILLGWILLCAAITWLSPWR